MKREIKTTTINNKNYKNIFLEEIKNIKNIPKLPYCEFLHIGSTAIENSFGEEIIDVLVVVNNLHEITSFDEKRLNNIGYHRTAHSEKGVITYCKIDDFFTMSYDIKLFVVQKNSISHQNFINFHTLLLENKNVFLEYQSFKKQNLNLKEKNKIYSKEKFIFINRKLKEAITND